MTNLHACLVHEEPDCVADLVANLRHHDPESLVLLYDGSEGRRLTRTGALVESEGVRVHPDPRPMTWGRLHGFAFDALRYAVESTDVTSVTIVDSDQLMLRPGYSRALRDHLRLNRDVGCLVSSDGGTQPATPAARWPAWPGASSTCGVRSCDGSRAASRAGRPGRSGRRR